MQDKKLVSFLADNNYHLEICLTSNIKTKTFNSFKDHPLNQIYDSSISLSLNTDGRTISDTNLSKEYLIAKEKFKWDNNKILQSNLNAVEHSFTTNKIKSKLRSMLKSAF